MSNETNFISAAPVRTVSEPAPHFCRLLESQANQLPGAIAIAAVGRTPLTYSRLSDQIDYVVKTLYSMDIRRNDRMALVLPNGPEMAVACIAVAACATSAPLNPAYRASEFDSYLTDLNPKALIVQSGVESPAVAVAEKRGIPILALSPMLDAEAGVFTLMAKDGSRQSRKAFIEAGDGVLEDVVLILHTSGTTSRAKLVPLTEANIYASARHVQAALEITSNDRYLNVMPLFHTQGIMLTIASMLAGASVVCTPGFSAAEFFKWIEEFQPTWYSAAPAIHQAIVSQSASNREIVARYRLRVIRSAASPLSPHLMAELEKAFRCPVIEGYGMTECYPITSNPLPPGKRKAGSVGVAAGTEVAIMDEAGKLLSVGETGEIVVSGPHVMRGYLNDSANNDGSFTNGWFKTGDQGYMDPGGYLFVTGRLKEMINRGGEKISPWEVDQVLLEHTAVSDGVAFAVPHITLGEEVAAAVVLRDKASVTVGEIQRFAAMRLAEFKVPRRVLIVKEIPKSATGKVQRIGLAEKLGLTGPNKEAHEKIADRTAPRTPVEEQLAKIWVQVLGLTTVGIHNNFFDLGGHSLLGEQLIEQIERVFGKRLPLTVLFQAPTIEQLAKILGQERSNESGSSLVPIQPYGSNLPFFCVHGYHSYLRLAHYLGANQPLYGLAQHLTGKQVRYTSVQDIAAHYLEEVRTLQPKGPYCLGGHSIGATIAFEMAQQLRKQGESVSLLALIDPVSPNPSSRSADLSTGFVTQLSIRSAKLAALSLHGKLNYIVGKGRERFLDGMKRTACRVYHLVGLSLPPGLQSFYVDKIVYGMLYPRAREAYVPQIYSGNAIIFQAEESSYDPELTWKEVITGGLEIQKVSGDHLSILAEPHVRLWAEALRIRLQREATGLSDA